MQQPPQKKNKNEGVPLAESDLFLLKTEEPESNVRSGDGRKNVKPIAIVPLWDPEMGEVAAKIR